MPCNKQERPATKKNESQRAATTSNALIWIQMTTDAPGDMIRMQNPNQAKRCLPEMAGAAIFIPERRIPSRTLLSFACGITAAPRKAEVLQAGHFAVTKQKNTFRMPKHRPTRWLPPRSLLLPSPLPRSSPPQCWRCLHLLNRKQLLQRRTAAWSSTGASVARSVVN